MLKELHFECRKEALMFLKSLWSGEPAACPVCGTMLEPLHRKAKSDNCDWQCRRCEKVYRTIHLLDEINEQMPD